MKVCVIGGGAAGMMAAITAADCGHQVLLLERQARVGRKLMATGNGRCNLSNYYTRSVNYHGEDSSFCVDALNAFNVESTLQWFQDHGLLTNIERGGRIYPYSNMAGSVLDVLRYALERPDIELRTGCTVTRVRRRGSGFTVETEQGSFSADKVILAAGGIAGGKVGGVMDGYQIGKQLGHHRTALYPSLVQIKTDPTYPRALKGVKAYAEIMLCRHADPATGQHAMALMQCDGEILFTEYGISGPAIFDISRAVATGGENLYLELDFLMGEAPDCTRAWVEKRRKAAGKREGSTLLAGTVHSRLGQMICKAAGVTNQPCDTLTEDDTKKIADLLRCFTLDVHGVCGFDQAQVTAGGLRTDEFNPQTMESKLVPGFYACGEVLDVDGDCGGYNLQWAWSSGHLAGLLME